MLQHVQVCGLQECGHDTSTREEGTDAAGRVCRGSGQPAEGRQIKTSFILASLTQQNDSSYYCKIWVLSNESRGGGGNLSVFASTGRQSRGSLGVSCTAGTNCHLRVLTMPNADHWQLHVTV